jgi:hypothetical protein
MGLTKANVSGMHGYTRHDGMHEIYGMTDDGPPVIGGLETRDHEQRID